MKCQHLACGGTVGPGWRMKSSCWMSVYINVTVRGFSNVQRAWCPPPPSVQSQVSHPSMTSFPPCRRGAGCLWNGVVIGSQCSCQRVAVQQTQVNTSAKLADPFAVAAAERPATVWLLAVRNVISRWPTLANWICCTNDESSIHLLHAFSAFGCLKI